MDMRKKKKHRGIVGQMHTQTNTFTFCKRKQICKRKGVNPICQKQTFFRLPYAMLHYIHKGETDHKKIH